MHRSGAALSASELDRCTFQSRIGQVKALLARSFGIGAAKHLVRDRSVASHWARRWVSGAHDVPAPRPRDLGHPAQAPGFSKPSPAIISPPKPQAPGRRGWIITWCGSMLRMVASLGYAISDQQ